ncbi:MAG: SpoIIE family protein phosphatase [Chlorobiaceae bacterium]|nr:SpoIIE family protein phosphatase [Chlorobiaceae bacterium]
MKANRSIVVRLIFVITFCSTLIFMAVLGYNYYRSRVLLEKELENNARNLALSLANRVETELVSVSRVVEGMAVSLETGNYSEEQLNALLCETLANNPRILGCTAAFEPYAFKSSLEMYASYFFRENGSIGYKQLQHTYSTLPYFYWDWYQIPRELGHGEWSEPYFDEGGANQLLTTCSVPFYEGKGEKRHIRGVVTADITLNSLMDLISSVKILRTGYAALFSRHGMALAHPLKNAVMNETFFSLAESRHDTGLRTIGRQMIWGKSGFVSCTNFLGKKSWMYYAPIRSTGWSIAVVFPEAELMDNVRSLTMVMAFIGFAGIAVLSATVYLIARSITGPLTSLAATSRKIAAGNFDLELPPARFHDEVGVLTTAFGSMALSLKEYIRNLTETTAAKERIQSELRLATDIQASLLPRVIPPYSGRREFDIFALMHPAKEVGGDFYDFFFLDETHLCFLVADVAGKGVPAALYMALAKTLLKSEGRKHGDPGQILFSVNDILAEDNQSSMFATVFFSVLDITSGTLRFANAGHNRPVLVRSEEIAFLDSIHGIVLGALGNCCFETVTITLAPGDMIFLYTDGVTEAMNRAGEFFGDARLLGTIGNGPKTGAEVIIQQVGEELGRFSAGTEQADDITMLAVIYHGMV